MREITIRDMQRSASWNAKQEGNHAVAVILKLCTEYSTVHSPLLWRVSRIAVPHIGSRSEC